MKIFLAALFLMFYANKSLANTDAPQLSARSIAEHCQFMYQIETEFHLRSTDAGSLGVVVWLWDLYEERFLKPRTFPIVMRNNHNEVAFSWNTMSTNPKYLAHEVYFAFYSDESVMPTSPSYKANFSHLMNRCYDRVHRSEAPYQNLKVDQI